MASASTSIDTVILGGGWSGLLSALRLAQAGPRKIVILEARNRIGGRAFTHTWDKETGLKDDRTTSSQDRWAADFGCSWIHGYNEGNPARSIAEAYGVKSNIPKPTPMQIVGPKGPLPAALSDKLSANLSKAQASLLETARNEGSSAPSPDSSLASHLLDHASHLYSDLSSSEEKDYATSLARSMHVPLGATLEEVSLRWHGFENNFAGTDAAPEGGFSSLINLIAQDAKQLGCEIKLGEVVQQVKQGEDGRIKIVTKTQEGEGEERTYQAESALCTIPLAVLKESVNMFHPSLPERRKATIARTHVGSLNKVLLTYSDPWWPSEIGTFMVLPTSHSSSPTSSIQEILSRTTLIVSSLCAPNGLPGPSPSLLVYVGVPASLEIEKFPRSEVVSALHSILAPRISKQSEENISEPIHTFYSRWSKQAFTRGATTTPTVVPKNQQDEAPSPLDFRELGLPLWKGRLGFAGEHTEIDHRGSVAGAIVSAEREAKRIGALLDNLNQKAEKASL